MNKGDFIKELARATGRKQRDCKELVEAALELIQKTISAQEDVLLQGFGTFKLKHKEARVGRNPGTGEEIEIPEKYVPVFSPAKGFVELCNNEDLEDDE